MAELKNYLRVVPVSPNKIVAMTEMRAGVLKLPVTAQNLVF